VSSYFFDTSALLKVYHPEAGTHRVEAIYQNTANRLIISRLAAVEIESAFSLRIRTGAISTEQRHRAAWKFYVYLANRLKVVAMDDIHFSVARKLILSYGAERGLRTLDALQLAVASELRRTGLIDFLVSADSALANVAYAEGIPTINPLTS
jgi:uncharacterized protein